MRATLFIVGQARVTFRESVRLIFIAWPRFCRRACGANQSEAGAGHEIRGRHPWRLRLLGGLWLRLPGRVGLANGQKPYLPGIRHHGRHQHRGSVRRHRLTAPALSSAGMPHSSSPLCSPRQLDMYSWSQIIPAWHLVPLSRRATAFKQSAKFPFRYTIDHMSTYQTAVSDAVRAYLDASCLSQKGLAAKLYLTQSTISRKLSGSRKWLLYDLDALAALGVELPAPGNPSVRDGASARAVGFEGIAYDEHLAAEIVRAVRGA